jgi:hypothetical protein
VGQDDAVVPLTEGDRAAEGALGLVAPACPAVAELRFAERSSVPTAWRSAVTLVMSKYSMACRLRENAASPTSKITHAKSRSLRTVSRSVSTASRQKRSARRSPSAIRGLDKIR